MVGSEREYISEHVNMREFPVPSWSGRNTILQEVSKEEVDFPVPSWSGRNQGKFWGFDDETKGNGKGLQSTFGCPKTLRGSTATDPSKLGHFRLKSPPRLYPVFKVLKTA